MKQTPWRILDLDIPSSIPKPNQDIYVTIAEGEGEPFQEPCRKKAEPDTFRELLEQHPQRLIIWQPVAPPPPAPANYRVLHENRCTASDFLRRRCEYCEFSRCLRLESEGPCEYKEPRREISLDKGGDNLCL